MSYIASNFTLNDFQLMAGEWFSKAMRWRTPSFVARGTFYVCFLSVDPHTQHTQRPNDDRWNAFGFGLSEIYTYTRAHVRKRTSTTKKNAEIANSPEIVHNFCVLFSIGFNFALFFFVFFGIRFWSLCHKTKRVNFGFEFTHTHGFR